MKPSVTIVAETRNPKRAMTESRPAGQSDGELFKDSEMG